MFRWMMQSNASGSSLKKVMKFTNISKIPNFSTKAVNDCEIVCRRGPMSRIACTPYIAKSPNDYDQTLLCIKYKVKTQNFEQYEFWWIFK